MSKSQIDRWNQLRLALCWESSVLAPALAALSIIESPKNSFIPTAGVDSRGRMFLNSTWAEKLDDGRARFVILHECLHMILRHWDRVASRDPMLFNIACFPAGTLLPGGVKIEDVAHPAMINPFKGGLYKIRTQVGEVSATPEHPFLVRRRRHKVGLHPIKLRDPEWLRAAEINVGDFICTPRLADAAITEQRVIDLTKYIVYGCDVKGRRTFGNRANNHELTLTEDLAWLIGLYVAEGSFATANGGVKLSLGSHETRLIGRAEAVIGALGYAPDIRINGTCATVGSGSSLLGRWLSDICGRGAHNKHVPTIIMSHADPTIRRAFLDGYVDGDGCLASARGVPYTVAGTVSKALALDLPLLLAQDTLGASVATQVHGPRWIGDQWCDKTEVIHNVAFRPNGGGVSTRVMNGKTIETHHARWKADPYGIWYPVKEITEVPYDGLVYNQTTEDHTYIASSYLVHNCDLVINDSIPKLSSRVTRPEEGIFRDRDAKWIPENLSAEEVYELLRANPDKVPKTVQGMAASGCGVILVDGDGDIVDGQGNKLKAEDVGLTPGEWRNLAQTVATLAKQAGTDGGAALAPLLKIPPSRVRWQSLLRTLASQAISRAGRDVVTWSRRGRRSSRRVILPGTRTNDVQLAIIIDSSGSMSDDDLGVCVAETHAAINASGISALLVVHDHEVRANVWITPGTAVTTVAKRVVGRGGTIFRGAYDAVRDAKVRFAGLVHFTDGYPGDPPWPDKPANCGAAICALTPDGSEAAIPDGWRIVPIEIPGRS